jgi:hypothetical protein
MLNIMSLITYFDLYVKSKKNYDRNLLITKLKLDTHKHITVKLIKNIFDYLDDIIFNMNLSKTILEHNLKLTFKILNLSNIKKAGYFYYKHNDIGIAISSHFFNNIIDKNMLNIDLGCIDNNNNIYYSKSVYEPLILTMEHEIIHMFMFLTQNYEKNDIKTKKSGHTSMFKKLAYNLFGHVRISHKYLFGDINEYKKLIIDFNIGDIIKYNNDEYVIVEKNKNYAVLYSDENKYKTGLYNKLEKTNKQNMTQIINEKLSKLKINVEFLLFDIHYVIKIINPKYLIAEIKNSNNVKKKISKIFILSIKFI